MNEREFILQSQRKYNAKSDYFTQIAIIEFDDFYEIIKSYPEDFEKFCILRDNL